MPDRRSASQSARLWTPGSPKATSTPSASSSSTISWAPVGIALPYRRLRPLRLLALGELLARHLDLRLALRARRVALGLHEQLPPLPRLRELRQLTHHR